MSRLLGSVRRARAPAIGLLVVVVGWFVLLRPLTIEAGRARAHLASLRAQLASLGTVRAEPAPDSGASPEGDDAQARFDRLIATPDPTSAIIGPLARLLSDAAARDLVIETVEAAKSSTGQTPAPSDDQHDPRISLFDGVTSASALRLAFTADYASVGQFLWGVRDLPSLVEVRSLAIRPLPPSSAEAAAGRLRASLSLLVHARATQPVPSAGGDQLTGQRLAAPPDVDLRHAPRWALSPFARPQRTPAAAVAAASNEPVIVTSILHSPERRLAIVNGRIVRTGDRVGSAVVVAIEPRHVVLEWPGGGRRAIDLLGDTAAR